MGKTYIKLISSEPYIEKAVVPENKSFEEVAKEVIRRGDREADLETVLPRLLEGRYGFTMDEYAVMYQPDANQAATVIYNYPDPLSDDWHAIMGPAIVGKVVQDGYDGYCFDFLNDEEAEKVMGLIFGAIQTVMK